MDSEFLTSDNNEYVPVGDIEEAIRESELTGKTIFDHFSLEDESYDTEALRAFQYSDGSHTF